MKIQIFHHAKTYKSSKKSSQNPSRYHNSIITNLKFQHEPKIESFKNAHIKIELLLPKGPKSIKLQNSLMNLNTIIIALLGKANKTNYLASEIDGCK
jgi:hypothetical protein